MSSSDKPLLLRVLGRIRDFFSETVPQPEPRTASEGEAGSPPGTLAPEAGPGVTDTAPLAADVAPEADVRPDPVADEAASDEPDVGSSPAVPALEPVAEPIPGPTAAEVPEVLDAVEALEEAVAEEAVAEEAVAEEAVAEEPVTGTATPAKPRKPRSPKPTAAPTAQPSKPARKPRAKKAVEVVPPSEPEPKAAAKPAARKPRARKAPVAEAAPVEAVAPSPTKPAARKPRAKPATKPASEKPKAARMPRVKPTA